MSGNATQCSHYKQLLKTKRAMKIKFPRSNFVKCLASFRGKKIYYRQTHIKIPEAKAQTKPEISQIIFD